MNSNPAPSTNSASNWVVTSTAEADIGLHDIWNELVGTSTSVPSIARRLVSNIRRQPSSAAGFPRVRPHDCFRVTEALRKLFNYNREYFRTCDAEIVHRFEHLVSELVDSDMKHYPSELLKLRLLQAESRLARHDPDGARLAIADSAERFYALEASADELAQLFKIDALIGLAQGTTGDLAKVTVSRLLMLLRSRPRRAWQYAREFRSQLSLGENPTLDDGVLSYTIRKLSRLALSLDREAGRPSVRFFHNRTITFLNGAIGCALFLRHRFGSLTPFSTDRKKNFESTVLLSRPMGGIGDILMMTPGFRALAKKNKSPIRVAINRKFFPVLANNPHVTLVDIDGPVIDLTKYKRWINFGQCPAGKYESQNRPYINKGRVELFAKGMGIKSSLLNKTGWNIELNLTEEQIAFRDAYLKHNNYLNCDIIIGIQPHSRDAYKDHPQIHQIIKAIAEKYKVILFHHERRDLPSNLNIANTAGLDLSKSLALVSAVSVMVSIDSAFLHAAAAFDIPVIALFGPTDASTFTRHHRTAVILKSGLNFPCVPCWRNEDLPCKVTGQVGTSPCIASFTPSEVLQAVRNTLAEFPSNLRS